MTPARQADTASPHIVTLQAQELTHGRMTEQPDVMATRPARAALPMVMMSHTRVPVSILRSMALTAALQHVLSLCEEVEHAQQGSSASAQEVAEVVSGNIPGTTGAHQKGLRLQVRE